MKTWTLLFCFCFLPICAAQQADDAVSAGQRLFDAQCAACHSLDGRGGGHAPNIAAASQAQSYSDERISGIIHDGVPSRGMPSFSSLQPDQISSVVRYLRRLQQSGTSGSSVESGDVKAGELLFSGKAQCSRCHMVKGMGGFIGPDITGLAMAPDAIREAIVHPDAKPTGVLVTATLRNGSSVSGLARNEDNFSLQLQDESGRFHFLMKSEISKIDRATQPYMPSDYSQRLSPAELRDLVSFLSSMAAPQKASRRRQ